MNKDLLLVFVKNPELGKCKTRLAATIGDVKALTFYRNMLKHTHAVVSKVEAQKQIYYSTFIDNSDLWPNDGDFIKALQASGDLGEKMKLAFKNGFSAGYERICIIGSDCYSISPAIIKEAFSSLREKDAVIGPSTDGGYYLIGMSQMIAEVFTDKNWSTEEVTPSTIKDLEALNKSYKLLISLTDIDNESDLLTIEKSEREALLK